MFAIDPRSASRVIALIGLTAARTPAKQIVRERCFVVHHIHSHPYVGVATRRQRDTGRRGFPIESLRWTRAGGSYR